MIAFLLHFFQISPFFVVDRFLLNKHAKQVSKAWFSSNILLKLHILVIAVKTQQNLQIPMNLVTHLRHPKIVSHPRVQYHPSQLLVDASFKQLKSASNASKVESMLPGSPFYFVIFPIVHSIINSKPTLWIYFLWVSFTSTSSVFLWVWKQP